MSIEQKVEEVCLYQFIPQKDYSILIYPQGHGNCAICIKDEKNKNCTGYYPIPVRSYEVLK